MSRRNKETAAKVETPVEETPVVEEAVTETPEDNTPSSVEETQPDLSVPEEPAVEEAVTETPEDNTPSSVEETQPDLSVPEEPAVEEAVVEEPTVEESNIDTGVLVEVDQYAHLSVVSRTLIEMVISHIETMDPKKPINLQKSKDSQRGLYRTLENVFKLPESKDFVAVMDTIVKLIVANKNGAFHAKHAFRCWSEIELSPDRLTAYNYYLTTMINIATAEDRRSAFDSVDFKLAFSTLDEKSRVRVVAYFKRICGA